MIETSREADAIYGFSKSLLSKNFDQLKATPDFI